MYQKKFFYIIGGALFFLVFYSLFLSPPMDFKNPVIFRIEQGSSLKSVSTQLKREHIIRSRVAFEAFVILSGAEKHLNYSDYFFEANLPVYEVARRISRGERHLAPVIVTIPEGFNTSEIADTAAVKLLGFDKNKFLFKAKQFEGYLFPDTYFFLTDDNEDSVISSMNANFNSKISSILPGIKSSGKSKSTIITMASIIEREAKGDADRGYIAGILWKRLSLGMPLQVDAAPETYKTKGLPNNPICNPGLPSIKAALYPQNSPYLYYLHDKNGVIHFARTFAEHIKNKNLYLK